MERTNDTADDPNQLPRTMERALFRLSCQRDERESMTNYISRKADLFRDLERIECPLADSAKGYILLRDAGLPESMRDVIVTWLGGYYGYEEVQDVLRDYERWTLRTESFSGCNAGDVHDTGSASSHTAASSSNVIARQEQPVANAEADDEMQPPPQPDVVEEEDDDRPPELCDCSSDEGVSGQARCDSS